MVHKIRVGFIAIWQALVRLVNIVSWLALLALISWAQHANIYATLFAIFLLSLRICISKISFYHFARSNARPIEPKVEPTRLACKA